MEKAVAKKVTLRVIIAVLCLGVIIGGAILLSGVLNPAKPKDSSPATVLGVISDKIEETGNKFAKTASAQTESTTDSDKVSANYLSGFKKGDAETYLELNYYASRIVYAVNYLAKNATTENGYANGFEYSKVYMGSLEIDGYEGAIYLKMDKLDTGVYLYYDFVSERYGIEIDIIGSLYAEYDFENDVVKDVKMNYQIMPLMTDLLVVEYDFVNNNFKGFEIYSGENNTPEQGTEILNAYNNGTLTAEKLITYDWSYAIMLNGNITDNMNNLDFYAYESKNSGNVSQITLTNFYNVLYNSLHTFKLRSKDEIIKTSDVVLVNYIQDCVDYGWNKSEYLTYEDDDHIKYYYFYFLEYEDMVKHLTSIKNTIDADTNTSTYMKTFASNALNYVQNRGKARYTGNLGQYNGMDMQATRDYEFVWNNGDYFYSPFYKLYTSNGSVINFKIRNNEIVDLTYFTPTQKGIYNAIEATKATGWYEYYKTDFEQIKNLLNKDSDNALRDNFTFGYHNISYNCIAIKITDDGYPNNGYEFRYNPTSKIFEFASYAPSWYFE